MNTKKEIILFFQSEEIKKILQEIGVEHLYLVGSFSRGENTLTSDIDLLYKVKKEVRVGGIKFLKHKMFIEKKLNRSIDLVEESSLNKHLVAFIEKDKKIIF